MIKIFSVASFGFLLSFLSTNLIAQDGLLDFFSKEDETVWHDGELMLSNKGLVKGKVNLSFKYDAVRIKAEESEDKVKTYSASIVDYVSYLDKKDEIKRVFYSLPYHNERTEHFGPTFFELIKDAGDFALIARLHYKDVTVQSGGFSSYSINTPEGAISGPGFSGGVTDRYKIENRTLYFIDRSGEVKPYVLIKANDSKKHLEKGRIIIKGRKYIDKKILKNLLGNYYDPCRDYSKEKNLNLKKVEDLEILLEYYKTLK